CSQRLPTHMTNRDGEMRCVLRQLHAVLSAAVLGGLVGEVIPPAFHRGADSTATKGLLGYALSVLRRYSALNQTFHIVRFRQLWRILRMHVAACPANDRFQPA